VIDGTLITATTSSTGAALIETFLGMLTDSSVPQAA
jgi:hypothetical protein